jgi:hypothetical protein
MQSPSNDFLRSRPVLMRLLVRSRDYRHPRAWVSIRLAGGAWNLGLGVLLLASGYWLGALAWLGLVPLLGAPLLFWTAWQLQHTVQSKVGVSHTQARTSGSHAAAPR